MSRMACTLTPDRFIHFQNQKQSTGNLWMERFILKFSRNDQGQRLNPPTPRGKLYRWIILLNMFLFSTNCSMYYLWVRI